jgi:D-sedoheptulose 7-phosphate isomerase
MTKAGPTPSHEFIRRLHGALDEIEVAAIEAAARSIGDAWRKDRRVFVLGNGGSAATASHFVSDLHGATRVTMGAGPPNPRGGRRLGAFSLTDNVPLLSALANDLGYERVFSEQIAASVHAHDVVVVLSASGDSENIVQAIAAARAADAHTIGILGFGGGRARALVDVAIVSSSKHYGIVESVHSAVTHLLAELVRAEATP